MDRDFTVFSQQTERQLQHWHAAAQLLRRHDLVASAQAWASLESYVGASIPAEPACGLRPAAARVRHRAGPLQCRPVAGGAGRGRRCDRPVPRQLHAVETLVDFYGDAINSRTGPELGAKLKAFDYVAGLSMQRMLRPLGQRTPPVLTYLDKGAGASILRAACASGMAER